MGREPGTSSVRGLLETWAAAHRAMPGAGEPGSRGAGELGSELGVTGLSFRPSSATDWHWDPRTVREWGGKGFSNCQVLCKGER